MVAIACVEAVAVLERVDGADRGGLLADGEMAVAADAGARVLLLGALLEPTDQRHRTEQTARGIRVGEDVWWGLGGLRHRQNLSGQSSRVEIMATPVTVPRLGDEMRSAILIRFLVAVGAPVRRGEPLYELDTDKVTQEVEAEAEGVLLRIDGDEGGEYEVGATLAWIGDQGEQLP
jgi:hypothetical protein